MSFRFLTAGESHGKALVGILEGIPSGLEISSENIHEELKRRKLGFGRGNRQKIESDQVKILSGVRFGKTLGSPIALLIENQDWENWQHVMQVEALTSTSKGSLEEKAVEIPRPGHADYVGGKKYQHEDMRNVLERASARETTIRVALGSIAKEFLKNLDVVIGSRVIRIGSVEDEDALSMPVHELNLRADLSSVRCTNSIVEEKMIHEIKKIQSEGDTLGGIFEVYASGLPLGLGSYVHWDRKLDGKIAQAFLSLNAIKGVEVGMGFESAKRTGSKVHGGYYLNSLNQVHFLNKNSNSTDGLDAGMTNGQNLLIRAAMKPLSTLMNPLSSVHLKKNKEEKAHVERSDVCAVPSAAVVGESLLALVLAESMLEKFGGDSLLEIKERVQLWNQKTSF